VGSRDPILDFSGPPNISGMNEARNFKFGILGHPNISGTVKARNFKIGAEMDGSEY